MFELWTIMRKCNVTLGGNEKCVVGKRSLGCPRHK